MVGHPQQPGTKNPHDDDLLIGIIVYRSCFISASVQGIDDALRLWQDSAPNVQSLPLSLSQLEQSDVASRIHGIEAASLWQLDHQSR